MPHSTDAMKAPRAEFPPSARARQALRTDIAARLNARPRTLTRATVGWWAAIMDLALVLLAALAVGGAGAQLYDVPAPRQCVALGMMGVTLVGLMRLFGAYGPEALGNPAKRITALSAAMVFLAAGAVLAGHFAGVDPAMARLVGPWALGVTVAVLTRGALFHAAAEQLKARGRFAPTVVLVGATEIAERLIAETRSFVHPPFEIVGIFDDRLTRVQATLANLPVLGTTEDLLKFEGIDRVDWVVIALPWAAEKRIAGLLGRLQPASARILLAPDLAGVNYARRGVAADGGLPLVEVLASPMEGGRRLVKELEDRVLGPVLALALLPVMLLIAFLVRLDSPGPALFKQRRIGYGGKAFDVYKFRTLRTDMADAVAARQVVAEDDPRVTRVGHYLRKYSLDELPQLINVLRGEMSLIGPRPYATGMMAGNTFAQDILVDYARRRRTKPGMTGWSQVNGGHGAITSEADLRRRLQHDLEYINHWSPLFDAYILWKTAEVVLTGRKKAAVPEPVAEARAQPAAPERAPAPGAAPHRTRRAA
jgi:exopolysaccharide biosynthesis polyprenyl glycosylphosphotransferase